jgi:hypothetical protein
VETHDRDIVNRIRKNRECLAPSIMDEAADEIERLERANIKLTAERDEARREVLLWIKERCSWIELAKEIKQRGWEYLKEDSK